MFQTYEGWGSLLLLAAALAAAGCDQKQGKGDEGSSSAASSSTAAAGKLVHLKRTQDECTFEADLPEAMKETAQDGISFTLESESFSFQAFAGTTLHAEPKHPLDMFKEGYTTVYRGTDSGLPLAIVKGTAAAKDPKDKHAVTGAGGEPYRSERPIGCTFLCDGVAAREADVVAFCKSVKITVSKPKGE